jgi:hypothetical protein
MINNPLRAMTCWYGLLIILHLLSITTNYLLVSSRPALRRGSGP